MKEYRFLDGTIIKVPDEVCRGCYLENVKISIEELNPIWSNRDFVIRQDAECPLPAFYIISTRRHINTIGDIDCLRAAQLGVIISELRKTMLSALGVKRIHMILEERLVEPQLHIWMLPLWPDVMRRNGIDPKIWNSNILDYINLFDYSENRETIIKYNKIMESVLGENQILNRLDSIFNR